MGQTLTRYFLSNNADVTGDKNDGCG